MFIHGLSITGDLSSFLASISTLLSKFISPFVHLIPISGETTLLHELKRDPDWIRAFVRRKDSELLFLSLTQLVYALPFVYAALAALGHGAVTLQCFLQPLRVFCIDERQCGKTQS